MQGGQRCSRHAVLRRKFQGHVQRACPFYLLPADERPHFDAAKIFSDAGGRGCLPPAGSAYRVSGGSLPDHVHPPTSPSPMAPADPQEVAQVPVQPSGLEMEFEDDSFKGV